MKYFWNFLCFLNILCFVVSTQCKPFNDTECLSEEDATICDKKLRILKSENEILKLRFDVIELNMEKQQLQLTSKLQGIENYLANSDGVARKQERVDELIPLLDARTKDMSLETFVENSPYSEERNNITLIMLQDIQSTLEKIKNRVYIEPQQDLLVGEQDIITHISGQEPMICMRTEDNELKCSKANFPTSCATSNSLNCYNNVCRIQNRLFGPDSFMVPCEDTSDGGGWTVIQRRINDSTDFYRDWSEYKQGFGDLNGNYWIGLDKLYALTTTLAPVELRIELMDFDNVKKYASYNSFAIGDEATKYILKSVGVYSGSAGDSFSGHKGSKFSTKDQDNDSHGGMHCAQKKEGGWWYFNCLHSNLNGRYYNTALVPKKNPDSRGICWGDFHGYDHSLKFVQMMIKPRR